MKISNRLSSALQLIGILPTIVASAAWFEKFPFRPNLQFSEAVPVAAIVSISMFAATLVLTRSAVKPSRRCLWGYLAAFIGLDLGTGIVWLIMSPGLGGHGVERIVNVGLWSLTLGLASVWVTLAVRLGTGKGTTFVFEVVIEPDEFEDGAPAFHAYCPLLPGCHTWGHTYQEALIKVQEAAALCAEDLLESGVTIPIPRSEQVVSHEAPTVIVHA